MVVGGVVSGVLEEGFVSFGVDGDLERGLALRW